MTMPMRPTYQNPSSFRISGKTGRDRDSLLSSLGDQYGSAGKAGAGIDDQLMKYFDDPSGGADGYMDIFTKAAQAAAAPASRDFNNSIGGVAASIARRFGGNASSEESRVVGNAADSFSRNLTEAVARTGPQAVSAGQARGSQLLSGSNAFANRGLDLAQLIQSVLQTKKPSPWGKIAGTAAGIGASFIPGVGQVAGPAILAATR